MWLTTSSVSTRMLCACAVVDEALEVVERAVDRVDRGVVGDVVAVVPERRRIEGEQPDAGDAEVLQILELLGQPREVADAVVVAVVERANVGFVDDRVFVPKRIGHSVMCLITKICDMRSADRAAHSSIRPATCSAPRPAGPRRCRGWPGGIPSSRIGTWTWPCCIWCGSVLATTKTRSAAGGLAVPEQRLVVGRVERERVVLLQGRMLPPDPVDLADQLLERVGLVVVARP